MNLNEAVHLAGQAQEDLQEAAQITDSVKRRLAEVQAGLAQANEKLTEATNKVGSLISAGYGNAEQSMAAINIAERTWSETMGTSTNALAQLDEMANSISAASAEIGEIIG